MVNLYACAGFEVNTNTVEKNGEQITDSFLDWKPTNEK